MSYEKSKIDDLLKVVCRLFPEAEVLKRDGSWERLSGMFELAADATAPGAESRQSKFEDRQMSFDFGGSFTDQQGGGT